MSIILGIESTAHTFGIGLVKDGRILSNVRDMYTTESGGIIPIESAKHHRAIADAVYFEALAQARISEKEIDAVAFSQGPGLAPCLLEGMKFAKELARKLARIDGSEPEQVQGSSPNKKLSADKSINGSKISRVKQGKSTPKTNLPIIPVNHCIAHLEIGHLTGAKDPVMLYVSGANTQVIAYSSGKYRVFGETLDIGVGNFIDTIGRFMGEGFPAGPKIQELASEGKNFIELPYKVKGMDVAFSGIQTKLKQLFDKLKFLNYSHPPTQLRSLRSQLDKDDNIKNKFLEIKKNSKTKNLAEPILSKSIRANDNERVNYTREDLAYSLQETIFAMLVETAERALAHTGKKELLLGGGVACNSRLQEMCKIMCEERGCKFFVPSWDLLVDNAAMIAYLGEIMFEAGMGNKKLGEIDISPRERTDDVEVRWR